MREKMPVELNGMTEPPHKMIELKPGEYTVHGRKYPRKLWFGLTDYGPPPFCWKRYLLQAVIAGVIVAVVAWAKQP
jgi:hypothetical protein